MTVGFSRAGWVVVWHDDTRSWILTPLGTRLLSGQFLLSVAGDDEKCFSSLKSFSEVHKNIEFVVCSLQWLNAFKYNQNIYDFYWKYLWWRWSSPKVKVEEDKSHNTLSILKHHKTRIPRLPTIHIHGYDPQFYALVTITMISFAPRPRRSVRWCCTVDGPKHEAVKTQFKLFWVWLSTVRLRAHCRSRQ